MIGLFRPAWPLLAIAAALFGCGFLTSLQFTAYNAIAYDEMDQARMSAATSFYATVQQLSLSMGVCIAATTLTLAMRAHHHATPGFSDFSLAIWSVAAISAAAILVNRRFASDAGADLSGR